MCSPRAQLANQVVALELIALFVAALKINVGVPPTIIVGGSALVGFFCWRATNLRRAITPVPATILFLLTTAALHHMAVSGSYYFPGLYTAVLPMIPGICAVWWMFRNRHVKLAA